MKASADAAAEKWVPMAQALVPAVLGELKSDWEGEPPGSVMHLFFLLLPKVREALAVQDDEFLRRAFAFAEWCMWQPEGDVWNSAGVGFYEHLFDSVRDTEPVCVWLSTKVLADIESLLHARYSAERLASIKAALRARKSDRSREAKDLARAAEQSTGVAA